MHSKPHHENRPHKTNFPARLGLTAEALFISETPRKDLGKSHIGLSEITRFIARDYRDQPTKYWMEMARHDYLPMQFSGITGHEQEG